MKEIPLDNGLSAIVDDDDFDHLSRYKWRAHNELGKSVWYAVRSVYFAAHPPEPWSSDTIRMHCQILLWFGGIDHINHNGLDNMK